MLIATGYALCALGGCGEVGHRSAEHGGEVEWVDCGGLKARLTPDRLDDIEGCDRYLGTIELSTFSDEDFKALSRLKHVSHLALVSEAGPTPFKGMEGLETVGVLSVHSHVIESLKGLEGLKAAAVVSIGGCERLRTFEGLGNLEEVGSLTIVQNTALAELESLTSLSSIEKNLHLSRVPALPQSQIDGFLERVHVEGHVFLHP
ncbi:MAG: hypothetical protein ACE366_24630 [Bradymonadia bacterium]